MGVEPYIWNYLKRGHTRFETIVALFKLFLLIFDCLEWLNNMIWRRIKYGSHTARGVGQHWCAPSIAPWPFWAARLCAAVEPMHTKSKFIRQHFYVFFMLGLKGQPDSHAAVGPNYVLAILSSCCLPPCSSPAHVIFSKKIFTNSFEAHTQTHKIKKKEPRSNLTPRVQLRHQSPYAFYPWATAALSANVPATPQRRFGFWKSPGAVIEPA